MIGSKVLPNLLQQTRRRINKRLGEIAYDTIRIKRIVSIMLSQRRSNFLKLSYSRNEVVSYQKLYGLNQHCKIRYDYRKRSLSEMVMFQVKKLFKEH
ncbi:hypothetical protein [Candidatus Enterovibrio altilux]|uniref:hypothetical protein n=1 Tax=Candidatus Enterovibrio altilux TaxID=1927128 RepID=UPI00125D6683|nr:hypothetical protein [Candidatus Enterovibrio luxaltus]